jgi:hypothetical protein
MILSKRLTLFSFEGRIVDASYNAVLKLWQTTSLILDMIEFILNYKRVCRGLFIASSRIMKTRWKIKKESDVQYPLNWLNLISATV